MAPKSKPAAKPPAAPPSQPANLKGPFWVIWKDLPDGAAARASAFILGGTSTPPHQPGFLTAGPFKTYADATAYKDQIGTGAILPAPGTPIIGDVTAGQPLAFLGFLGGISHWLGVAVTDLTDIHLWISLGWLFLGLILLVIGIVLWLKHEDLLPKPPAVVPVPLPV